MSSPAHSARAHSRSDPLQDSKPVMVLLTLRSARGRQTADARVPQLKLLPCTSSRRRRRCQPLGLRGTTCSGSWASVPSATFLRLRYPVSYPKKLHYLGAPLRNRTVDLLLTMDR